MAQDFQTFIENLPKVELHAHINGSLSNKTLSKLSQLKNKSIGDTSEYTVFEDLIECFEKFKYAYALTDTPDAVALATECVIRDFSEDHVAYVELRTTPRATELMSKHDYISAVIKSIIKMRLELPNILVKLLISISRRESIESAAENVSIAINCHKLHPDIICGVDLSGDPTCNSFEDYKSQITRARDAGLKLALHCGEVQNDSEIKSMLEFGMDRLGHGTFISGSNEEILLKKNEITLECCLTSNLLCKSVATYSDHHFWRFFRYGHPVVICTDDFGVFDTNLSKELQIACNTFDLNRSDLVKLCLTAVNSSFASDREKEEIRSQIEMYADENLKKKRSQINF